MSKNESGIQYAKLGFGLMRLPMLGADVDLDQVKAMVDLFMSKGFTYFDTAYVYMNGKSEEAARETLVKRYPRTSFQIASKLAIWEVQNKNDLQKMFDISLQRCGITYFDYYLLHNVGGDRTQKYEDFGAWEFLTGLKEKGLAKHIGFSFHDNAELLDQVLTQHPEVDFVQLQINYGDWNDPIIQSRLCYETARRHNKPVIIMEPVKGGSLASLSPEIESIFQEADPNHSPASWAIRFAASLEGVITVLSGMSTLEQMQDNVSYMENVKPLGKKELAVLENVQKILKDIPTVPCTACKYCLKGCPQGIQIPGIFKAYNNYTIYKNFKLASGNYNWETRNGNKASVCLQCGACEQSCPQHIFIIKSLQEAAALFEK